MPNETLTYSLINPPAGAAINGATGAFSFTPTSAQVGTYNITVRVTDSGNADNSGRLYSESDISITVNKHATAVQYTGAASGTYGSPATFSATLFDTSTSTTATLGRTISFAFGTQTASAATNGSGFATTSPIVTQPGGSISVVTSFIGDTAYLAAADDSDTFTVNKATPTIVWNTPAAITYGTPLSNTQLNALVNGVSGGQPVGLRSYSPLAGTVLNAGTQTLNVSVAETAYYNAASRSVSLVVNPAPLTIGIANASRAYGAANPTFTPTYSGLVNGDTPASLGGAFAFNTSAAANSPVGNYAVSPSGVTSNNYNITFSDGVLTVNPALLTVTANNQTTQYSDAIPAFDYSISGFVNNENASVVSGNPALSSTGTSSSAPGDYTIAYAVGTLSAANYTFTGNNGVLHILPEDARATYTGVMHKATTATGTNTAQVTLTATVAEISDGSPGAISNALVSFVNRDTNSVLASNVPVAANGTAATIVTLSTGAADAEIFNVGVVVGGFYARNASEDNSLVTVAKPISTNFISGGGNLVLQQSSGVFPGATNTLMNFGLSVKHLANGASPTGKFAVLLRSNGRVYQVKGASYSSMTVNNANTLARTAVLNAANGVTVMDVTDPLAPFTVVTAQPPTVQITMTDRGEPGTTDSIGISVKDGSTMLFSSRTIDSITTLEQTIGGQTGAGNIIFRYISSPR